MTFTIVGKLPGDSQGNTLKTLTTTRKGRAERQLKDFVKENAPSFPEGTTFTLEEK